MATFDSLEVKIDRLNAFEGESLRRFDAETSLGIADNDAQMASEAETEVKLDLIDATDKYYYDSSYDTLQELLDAIADVDSDSLIERLMAIKFLELFFGDQTINTNNAAQKASFYESKYHAELPKVTSQLMSSLDPPKLPNRPRFVR